MGKTAIAEGFALLIAQGRVPVKLRDKEVYLLDMTGLVAGTQFRGQFEARMKAIINEVTSAGNVILVIDEIHNIMGAGDAQGSMNAANILKPALANGSLQVIGTPRWKNTENTLKKTLRWSAVFSLLLLTNPLPRKPLKFSRAFVLITNNTITS